MKIRDTNKKITIISKKVLTRVELTDIILFVDSAEHWRHRGIAKLVRHGILNPACVGSSPATPAI